MQTQDRQLLKLESGKSFYNILILIKDNVVYTNLVLLKLDNNCIKENNVSAKRNSKLKKT